jgi:hypothetical protein
MRFVWPIAYCTLLEALRGRLLAIVAAVAAAALGVAAFLSQVAITEAAQVQAAIISAVLRLCAVFLLTSFVVSSMVREFADKGVELLLSQPMPRWAYLFGKYAGYASTAVGVAFISSLPLLLVAPGERVLAWGTSLAAELLVVAAVSLFCVLSLSHVVAAMAAVAGFYVLSRAMDGIQIIATSGGPPDGLADRVSAGVVDALALVLPSFGRMTEAAWLTDTIPAGAVTMALVQSALYVSLILAASLFDLHRQNF